MTAAGGGGAVCSSFALRTAWPLTCWKGDIWLCNSNTSRIRSKFDRGNTGVSRGGDARGLLVVLEWLMIENLSPERKIPVEVT